MNWTDNTIFITGGGSGIGRGLAEALHRKGNRVIIAGRRAGRLAEVTAANPGMRSVEVDLRDPADITAVASRLIAEHPALNVVINNAGVMEFDDASGPVDERLLVDTLTTNLMAPIRVTGAFVEHLKRQPQAAIVNTTSVLGFIPLAATAVYCAAKAALHSYTLSLRYKLRGTPVRVIELLPPWVQTDLLNSNAEPRAMPLAEFIGEVTALLDGGGDEIVVRRARLLRRAAGPADGRFTVELNDDVAAGFAVI